MLAIPKVDFQYLHFTLDLPPTPGCNRHEYYIFSRGSLYIFGNATVGGWGVGPTFIENTDFLQKKKNFKTKQIQRMCCFVQENNPSEENQDCFSGFDLECNQHLITCIEPSHFPCSPQSPPVHNGHNTLCHISMS